MKTIILAILKLALVLAVTALSPIAGLTLSHSITDSDAGDEYEY